MSTNCNNDCSACGENCASRTAPQSFLKPLHSGSSVGRVIAVVSGKGGVGKSLVTSSLAVAMRRMGKTVGVLDADITGPSIPTAFGVHARAEGSELGIYPAVTRTGVEIMSLNLLTANETDPVIWRGPVIAGAVKQFWTDVLWNDVDYMFVDMPPGTGDVPLTVFQSLPIDGVIVVTSPQDLVSMIVTKAVKMAEMMKIPVLGLVENYSYFKCPDCGKEHSIFGQSRIDKVAGELGLRVLARLPIDPGVAAACPPLCFRLPASVARLLPLHEHGLHQHHVEYGAAENGQKVIVLPHVQRRHRRCRDQLGGPPGGGREGDALQAVDHQHGNDGGREHPSQVEDDLGRRLAPVKEQKGQKSGEKGHCRHDRDGGHGVSGTQHDVSSVSSSRSRSTSSASTITPRETSSICC